MRPHKTPSSGKITRGLTANKLVERTMEFIRRQLPAWRDDKTRKYAESEEELNGQLCKFLNNQARDDFPMAFFHHEEKQGKQRRVDMSALPTTKAIEAAIYASIYDPFLVMEGKRLPTPTAAREREYLTGMDDKSGGVQRFRMCLHGKAHTTAVMIGYVQSGDVKHWRKTINSWIRALRDSNEDKTCMWTTKDNLGALTNSGKKHTCRCESKHARSGGSAKIRLVHFWIRMARDQVKKKSL